MENIKFRNEDLKKKKEFVTSIFASEASSKYSEEYFYYLNEIFWNVGEKLKKATTLASLA